MALARHDPRLPATLAWDDFVRTAGRRSGFMQASWWADVLATQDWGHFGAVFRDGGEILGGARVLTSVFEPGRCFYYIPEGPVLPDDPDLAADLYRGMMAHIDQKRRRQPETVSHLRIEPKWTTTPAFLEGWRAFSGWLEPRRTLVVDLRPSEDGILAQMKPKGRYNIRLAQKRGVRVVEDSSPAGIDDFLEIYQETMARKGTEVMDVDYQVTLIDTLIAHDCGGLFFAEYQGLRLATVLAVFHGDRATYFFGGSRPVHRHLMAPYLVHFEVMKRARARGHTVYDLYGIAPPDDPGHMWADISAFKRKFGGDDVQYIPAQDFVYDQAGYQTYLATL